MELSLRVNHLRKQLPLSAFETHTKKPKCASDLEAQLITSVARFAESSKLPRHQRAASGRRLKTAGQVNDN